MENVKFTRDSTVIRICVEVGIECLAYISQLYTNCIIKTVYLVGYAFQNISQNTYSMLDCCDYVI